MTYNELYRHIISVLKKAGIDSPAFDALCIFESKLGLTRHDLIMTGNKEAEKDQCDAVEELATKRAEGYPLQYLLGMWQFMDSEFFVGEGVLIPREDTSVVVQLCLDNIKNLYGTDNLSIIDLCAGSGAISISLAKSLPNSKGSLITRQLFNNLELRIRGFRSNLSCTGLLGSYRRSCPQRYVPVECVFDFQGS